MSFMRFLFFAISLFLLPVFASASGLGSDVRQLLVAIAPDWNSSSGELFGLQKSPDGTWKNTLGQPIPVLFGKQGLAWGRGVLGADEHGLHKTENDRRAPAGVFKIGRIYTYDAALPAGAEYPFHTVTDGDAWVDDPALPEYNRYVAVDLRNPPPWYARQRMRLNDFAYRWLVEIRHNADPPVPGMGSAIFFHIRRGKTRPTSGCTSMSEANLVRTIRWLRASEHPHYALLPRVEYRLKRKAWGLPDNILAAAPGTLAEKK